MSKTCSRCDAREYSRGFCKYHYRKDWAMRVARGDRDRVDTAPVLAHRQKLRLKGWPDDRIAREARIHRDVHRRVITGELTTLPREAVDRYLALPVVWVRSKLSIPFVGTARRLSALAWQGWSSAEVARQLGLHEATFVNARRRGVISARIAAAVDDFYRSRAYQPGPDPSYARRARQRGAIPAAAWDDDTIDDPDAQHVDVLTPTQRRRRSRSELIEDARWLLSQGEHIDLVAQRLRIRRDQLTSHLRTGDTSGAVA